LGGKTVILTDPHFPSGISPQPAPRGGLAGVKGRGFKKWGD